MADIKVSAEDVQGTAGQLANGHQQLTDLHQQMVGHVQSMVDGNWTGTASNSFQESWSKYNSGANQMFEALREIHGGLTTTANAYSETEQKLTSGWA